MRHPFIALALSATAIAASPAAAQYNPEDGLRMQSRQAVDHSPDNLRSLRDWREYRRFDFDRIEPGQQGYFAERYYRRSGDYQPRVLTADDRIYRGGNDRYYCRRSDSTTGLIGAGVNGARLERGESRLLGADAARERVTCR